MKVYFWEELKNEKRKVIAKNLNNVILNEDELDSKDFFITNKDLTDKLEGYIIKKEIWKEVLRLIRKNKDITKEDILDSFDKQNETEYAIGALKKEGYIEENNKNYRLRQNGIDEL